MTAHRGRAASGSGVSGWRPWLDTVLPMAARASELAAVIAEATDEAYRPARRLVRQGRFIFMRGGAARPSPRARGRSGRSWLALRLATACQVCVLWLRAGGSRLLRDGLPWTLRHSDPAWGPCLRWGRAASRLDPGSGWDHGRGRVRGVLTSIAGHISLTTGGADISDQGLAAELYSGAARTAAVDFDASRISFPECAARLPLGDWLAPDLLEAFIRPAPSGRAACDAAPRFFNARQAEWRKALRRMGRAGLITALAPDLVPPGLCAGAFAVRKDADRDRLIGDRRPMNSLETIIANPDLPFVGDLTWWYLPPELSLRLHSRDLKDMYYQLLVPPGAVARAGDWAAGPRRLVPRLGHPGPGRLAGW